MEIQLLGQGYEEESLNSVGTHLIKLLADEEFESFTAISAFVSQVGIMGLSKHINKAKEHLKTITIITGVDQKGTSKEALDSLIELGVNAYVFYQPSITIFHPKIYLFEGNKKSVLIIGSSNLTAQGLFSNIEASLLITIDNDEDKKIIAQLKEYYKGLFDLTEPNLKELDKKLIKGLLKAKVVPLEEERKAIQDKAKKSTNKETEKLIYQIFPKRAIAKVPPEFRIKRKAGKTKKKNISSLSLGIKSVQKGVVAWQRKGLPASSVQASPGGNPTGGLRLVQAKFKIGEKVIDQTTYFRNTVFSNLTWWTDGKSEIANASFQIIIGGKSLGIHVLQIRHKPSGEAGQGNYTTLISWGTIGEDIRKANLKGKTLTLFYPYSKNNPYTIEIN
jgi:HKD family nuclease